MYWRPFKIQLTTTVIDRLASFAVGLGLFRTAIDPFALNSVPFTCGLEFARSIATHVLSTPRIFLRQDRDHLFIYFHKTVREGQGPKTFLSIKARLEGLSVTVRRAVVFIDGLVCSCGAAASVSARFVSASEAGAAVRPSQRNSLLYLQSSARFPTLTPLSPTRGPHIRRHRRPSQSEVPPTNPCEGQQTRRGDPWLPQDAASSARRGRLLALLRRWTLRKVCDMSP